MIPSKFKRFLRQAERHECLSKRENFLFGPENRQRDSTNKKRKYFF